MIDKLKKKFLDMILELMPFWNGYKVCGKGPAQEPAIILNKLEGDELK